jgi:uncharacterized protein
MHALRRVIVAASAALLACAALAADVQPVPSLNARVTDTTGTLDATQKQTLEDEFAALEKRKGAQIAVLVVPTTQPEAIEQYSIRVFDNWALGRKGVDDGVLLLVAKDDHRVRIEPGRGLEGAIPDAIAARIIREYVQPKFRAGDFYGGIHDATQQLTKLIDGEALPPSLVDDRSSAHKPASGVLHAALFAFFAILVARSVFGGLPAPPRGGLTAVVGGGAAWLLSGGVLGLAMVLGVVGLVFGLLGGGGGGFVNRGGWGGWGGGFGGGSFGGGNWGGGGGGFGGGGFSGGGGTSSGGGASGSW